MGPDYSAQKSQKYGDRRRGPEYRRIVELRHLFGAFGISLRDTVGERIGNAQIKHRQHHDRGTDRYPRSRIVLNQDTES